MEKIQTFVAHPEGVTTIKIGPSSGQVVATGGNDNIVNLWRIGRAASLMSIPVAKSAVQCVDFDSEEKYLAAGTNSGSIHVLSLNAGGKTKARLSGHRSACLCASFHPLGNVIVSGSSDTTVKVWDLRNKSCVRTLAGHTHPVRCVEYSPDGQWIASGSDDGTVKLWDLKSGKLLHDFVPKTRAAPITCVKFHPEEFWLATGATDGSVKYWDLETFRLVGSTPTENSSSVRNISFFKDSEEEDQKLVSASDDGLRIWNWQPCRCVAFEPVQWDTVVDSHISYSRERDEHLTLATMKASMVSIWTVNLTKTGESLHEKKPATMDSPVSSELEDSYEADFFPDEEEAPPVVNAPPPRKEYAPSKPKAEPRPRRENVAPVVRTPREEVRSRDEAKVSGKELPAESEDVPSIDSKVNDAPVPQSRHHKRQHLVPCISSSRDTPLGLSISEFVPRSLNGISANVIRSETKLNLAEEILLGHEKFLNVMEERIDEVTHAVDMWHRGENLAAIAYVAQVNITSVSYDFIRIVNLKNGQPPATLEICSSTLPILANLLDDMFENHIKLALATAKYLVDSFHDIIVGTLCYERKSNARGGAVDISRDERVGKCKQCLEGFRQVSTAVGNLLSSSSQDMVARTRNESEFLAAKLDKMLSQVAAV